MRWGHVQEWPPGQRVHDPAGTLTLCVCSERLGSARQRRVTVKQVARVATRNGQVHCSKPRIRHCSVTVKFEPVECVKDTATTTPAVQDSLRD
eukprot:scaffold32833_cov66-Phaeocystis_antarctica.AAC.2